MLCAAFKTAKRSLVLKLLCWILCHAHSILKQYIESQKNSRLKRALPRPEGRGLRHDFSIIKAFKFRLDPNREAAATMARMAGCARFVWNKALALQKDRLDRKESLLSYVQVAKELTKWRHAEETTFLSEMHVHTQQQKLRDLDRA